MPDTAEILLLSLIVAVVLLPAIPGYVLARRRGLGAPAVAFIPLVGLWIVVFRSIGWTGWLLGVLVGLVVLTPYVGLVVTAWAGVQVPAVHRRSRWWIALLAVPVLNLVGYWIYAFTLPKPTDLRVARAG